MEIAHDIIIIIIIIAAARRRHYARVVRVHTRSVHDERSTPCWYGAQTTPCYTAVCPLIMFNTRVHGKRVLPGRPDDGDSGRGGSRVRRSQLADDRLAGENFRPEKFPDDDGVMIFNYIIYTYMYFNYIVIFRVFHAAPKRPTGDRRERCKECTGKLQNQTDRNVGTQNNIKRLPLRSLQLLNSILTSTLYFTRVLKHVVSRIFHE